MAAPRAKRARQNVDESSASAVSVNELSHCHTIQLKAADIIPWRDHVLLYDLLRGCLLRVRVTCPDGSAACVVGRFLALGSAVPAYQLQLPQGQQGGAPAAVDCTVSLSVMLLGRPGAPAGSAHKPTHMPACKLSRLSSSDVTPREWALAVKCIQASRAQVPPGKEPPSWCRSLTGPRVAPVAGRQARLLADLAAHCAVARVQPQEVGVEGALWGRPAPGAPPHGVVLLLRSWLASPGPARSDTHCDVLLPPQVLATLKAPQGASEAAAAAAGASASQTDVFKAALGGVARPETWRSAPPHSALTQEHVNSLLEAGAFGQNDKFRGHFSFLLAAGGGSRSAAPVMHAADAKHECNPEITAYSAMRKHIKWLTDAFTPQLLQGAIVDCVGLPSASSGARAAADSGQQPPALPSRIAQSETFSNSHTAALPPAARMSGACVLSTLEAYEQGGAVFQCQAPPRWQHKRRNRSHLAPTQIVIVDMDVLMRAGALRHRVAAPPAGAGGSAAATSLIWAAEDACMAPSGEVKVLSQQAAALLQQPCLRGHTALGGGSAARENSAPLFHGCSVSAASGIISGGFRRPVCRALARCATGVCFCQMHGMGLYFARADKALSFGKRRAQPLADVPGGIQPRDVAALRDACAAAGVAFEDLRKDGDAASGPLGAVLLCEVRLGRCKVQQGARDVAYPGVAGTEFTDHTGRWHAWEGYDSVHLLDGSMPVARKAEWCVSDPGRVRITHCFLVENGTSADEVIQAVQ